ncbi:hypothetical protein [Chryseobacterium balustinum]|uniref:Lipoprotein n=1 Tax=Chryseobacterium balustinum TaxID=246 RepID=A0AAX2IEU4_9FLAO|nr:hypothetical protein [Chryseobacterium balustinum]AZB28523.1 hypothetical protein EB354_04180 [Chryseobacterium balustinum]SKB76680.1 hypothetical protein SAMN05421800_10815 [Chryseobacterium balustinum]SQA86647.1 Uncharacterised protein [Chryseobacterium balustinum]
MKKTLSLCCIALSLLIFSCKSENKKTEKQITATEQITQPKTEKPADKKEIQDIDFSEYSKLAPIELKESKSKNVFKKYGTEFSGNCYACDLAVFKINKKNFDIVNVCDDNDFKRFKDFKYEKSGNILKITTSETTFIFTKVENEPIYQLTFEGKKPDLKNKRISEFYTPETLIEKFEEHDCGDFEG